VSPSDSAINRSLFARHLGSAFPRISPSVDKADRPSRPVAAEDIAEAETAVATARGILDYAVAMERTLKAARALGFPIQ
jgi:hypothetical protein